MFVYLYMRMAKKNQELQEDRDRESKKQKQLDRVRRRLARQQDPSLDPTHTPPLDSLPNASAEEKKNRRARRIRLRREKRRNKIGELQLQNTDCNMQ